MEADAANWIKDSEIKKPVVALLLVKSPKGRTMGHAGAIVGGKDDTAEAKKEILKSCGIHVVVPLQTSEKWLKSFKIMKLLSKKYINNRG